MSGKVHICQLSRIMIVGIQGSGEGGGGGVQEKSPEFRFPEVGISESHCLKKQRNFTIPSHL